jgi:hypothetical protein
MEQTNKKTQTQDVPENTSSETLHYKVQMYHILITITFKIVLIGQKGHGFKRIHVKYITFSPATWTYI